MHKALGRGLEALIPTVKKENIAAKNALAISLDKITPNRYQPRHEFHEEKLSDLADSIRRHGVAQPIVVAPGANPGEYELIAGERRWRAAKLAGLKEIPAVVRNVSEQERFQLALVENIQREDLNPIEEANAYSHLMKEFSVTQEDLAGSLGKSRSVVANALRLLALPEDIKRRVAQGALSSGHARALLCLDSEEAQLRLAEKILAEGMTVREAEDAAKGEKQLQPRWERTSDVVALEEELQKILATKVVIAHRKDRGKIVLPYYSLDDFERLTGLLKSCHSKIPGTAQ